MIYDEQIALNFNGYEDIYEIQYKALQIPMFPYEVFYNVICVDEWFIKQNYYLISNYGRLYSLYSKFIMNPRTDDHDYQIVSLSLANGGNRNFKLHRVVLGTIFPIFNSNKFTVNHKDTNKFNNAVWNLEWATVAMNNAHAIANNLRDFAKGERSALSTLSDIEVFQICEILSTDCKTQFKDIASKFNVTSTAIEKIYHKKNWLHISDNYTFLERGNSSNFTLDQIHFICKYFQDISSARIDYIKIAEVFKMNCDKRFMDRLDSIRRGTNYKQISCQYNIVY